MRNLGRAALAVVVSLIAWSQPARAVDITGTWSLCASDAVAPFGCLPFTSPLIAVGNAFTMTIPGTCTITGTVDPMSGAITVPPGQCPPWLLSFTGVASDTEITATLSIATCTPFSVTGFRECAACDDGNDCTVDGCGATACSQPSSSCTYAAHPTGMACDDDNACTSGETCLANSVCGGGSQTGCNDGNPCTNDACDPQTGACVFTPNTSPCNDGTLCTAGDTCSGGACVPGTPVACAPCETCRPLAGCILAPKTGCRGSVNPAKTKILLKDSAIDAKDKIAWTWGAGVATGAGDFGDPVGGDDYRLCVFDQLAGAPRLLVNSLAPGGGSCADGASCWQARGNPPGVSGFVYKDTGLLLPDGLKRVVLKPGVDGRAKAIAKGQGTELALPSPMNVTLPVTAQLQAANGECFETTFTSARTSREDLFKASGSPSGAFVDGR